MLSDPERRRRYDVHGPEGTPGSAGAGGGQGRPGPVKTYALFPFDLYVHTPSGGFEVRRAALGGRCFDCSALTNATPLQFHLERNSPPKAEDVMLDVPLTLEEVYSGVNKSIPVRRQRMCPVCGGRGALHANGTEPCKACEASGRHLYTYADRWGYKHVVNTTCEWCEGTGHVVTQPCERCGGRRLLVADTVINITIPAGTPDGERIPMGGEGNERLGFTAGNLVLVVRYLPHAKFTALEGGHLLYKAQIPLIDALVGFQRNLTLLTGEKLLINHDIVTFSGYRQTYHGKGLPLLNQEDEEALPFADLDVEFSVLFPRRLSMEQRTILRDLMDEEELAILEDVIRLAAARDAERASWLMDDEEVEHTRDCDVDNPFICPYDPLVELILQVAAQAPPNKRDAPGS